MKFKPDSIPFGDLTSSNRFFLCKIETVDHNLSITISQLQNGLKTKRFLISLAQGHLAVPCALIYNKVIPLSITIQMFCWRSVDNQLQGAIPQWQAVWAFHCLSSKTLQILNSATHLATETLGGLHVFIVSSLKGCIMFVLCLACSSGPVSGSYYSCCYVTSFLKFVGFSLPSAGACVT